MYDVLVVIYSDDQIEPSVQYLKAISLQLIAHFIYLVCIISKLCTFIMMLLFIYVCYQCNIYISTER